MVIQPKVKRIEILSGKDRFLLLQRYIYQWKTKTGIRRRIIINKGFVFDGASIPWIFRKIFSVTKGGDLLAASIIHDFICRFSGNLPIGSYMVVKGEQWKDCSHERWSWNAAAKMFARIMRETGIPKWKRRSFYRAIRVYGWFVAWKI